MNLWFYLFLIILRCKIKCFENQSNFCFRVQVHNVILENISIMFWTFNSDVVFFVVVPFVIYPKIGRFKVFGSSNLVNLISLELIFA